MINIDDKEDREATLQELSHTLTRNLENAVIEYNKFHNIQVHLTWEKR